VSSAKSPAGAPTPLSPTVNVHSPRSDSTPPCAGAALTHALANESLTPSDTHTVTFTLSEDDGTDTPDHRNTSDWVPFGYCWLLCDSDCAAEEEEMVTGEEDVTNVALHQSAVGDTKKPYLQQAKKVDEKRKA
jgi:hypothetical protein